MKFIRLLFVCALSIFIFNLSNAQSVIGNKNFLKALFAIGEVSGSELAYGSMFGSDNYTLISISEFSDKNTNSKTDSLKIAWGYLFRLLDSNKNGILLGLEFGLGYEERDYTHFDWSYYDYRLINLTEQDLFIELGFCLELTFHDRYFLTQELKHRTDSMDSRIYFATGFGVFF
jgi:hypothetical protein